MANELTSGKCAASITAKILLYKKDYSKVWSTTGTPGWVDFVIGDIANYKIAATDLTGRGNYAGSMPAVTDSGTYIFEFINNADNVTFAEGSIDWDGSAEIVANNYYAAVYFCRDQNNTVDDYLVVWYRNGIPVTSEITTPLIQIISPTDGSDILASTAMTEISGTGAYKYTEASGRITKGLGALVKVTATINGAARTFTHPVGRDTP